MGISSRAAGFRFSEEEYGMMDGLRERFWMLFANRRAVLCFALRRLWQVAFTQSTLSECLSLLQRSLRAQDEHIVHTQLSIPFPSQALLRPKFGQEIR
jgi:hypothetical protein